MGVEENARVVRRYLEVAWGKGDLAAVDETCSPLVEMYSPGGSEPRRGIDQIKGLIAFVRGVFPDFCVRVDETIAEGSGVAARWSDSGTQKGEWQSGIPPTGRGVSWTGMSMYRLIEGRIVEERFEEDLLHLQLRLGLIVEAKPSGP